jgi:Gamma-glutamyltranspeptidase
VYTRPVRSLLVLVLLVGCAAPLPPPPPAALPSEPPSCAAAPSTAAAPPVPCQGETFGLPPGADTVAQANIAAKRGTMGSATTQMVATSNAVATEAGLAVLRSGGDAADAFVAAALVEDLVLPGVTSTAGLSGILVYEAGTRAVTYVHGGLADPQDPARRFQRGDVESGRLVLVPGAPAAYAEVIRRFGRKSLAFAVEPAASLASKGFRIDALYAGSIADSRAKLEASAFGRATYFRAGRLLHEGDTLKLEETAKTLRSFGKDPRWFYRGPWVEAAVRTANEHGGTLAARDFDAYAVEAAAEGTSPNTLRGLGARPRRFTVPMKPRTAAPVRPPTRMTSAEPDEAIVGSAMIRAVSARTSSVKRGVPATIRFMSAVPAGYFRAAAREIRPASRICATVSHLEGRVSHLDGAGAVASARAGVGWPG